MRKPYRTIEDVLRSPWAAAGQPTERAATDRVLRSTKLEDSIYADLRDGDDSLEQTERGGGKKAALFPGAVPGRISVFLLPAAQEKRGKYPVCSRPEV